MSAEQFDCPFCHEQHDTQTIDLFGHQIQVCPKLPAGTVYIDEEYDKGPRGSLLSFGGTNKASSTKENPA